jgi:hypothetical protein
MIIIGHYYVNLNSDVKHFSVIVKKKRKSINCLKLYSELWSCDAIKATSACSGCRQSESCMCAVSSDLAFCGFPQFLQRHRHKTTHMLLFFNDHISFDVTTCTFYA